MICDLIFFSFHKRKIQSNLLQGMQMFSGHVNAFTRSASKYHNITRDYQILDFKLRNGPCTHWLKKKHTITCAWRASGLSDNVVHLYVESPPSCTYTYCIWTCTLTRRRSEFDVRIVVEKHAIIIIIDIIMTVRASQNHNVLCPTSRARRSGASGFRRRPASVILWRFIVFPHYPLSILTKYKKKNSIT